MGVLTDFIVADVADAERLGLARQDFEGVDAKGINQVHMGTLYAILSGTEYNPSFMVDDSSFVFTASDDGPWVQQVPSDMVTQLAAVADADLPRITDAWASTEEFEPQYSGFTREDIEATVRQLRTLAQLAVQKKKSLFMWTCL